MSSAIDQSGHWSLRFSLTALYSIQCIEHVRLRRRLVYGHEVHLHIATGAM